MAEAQRLELCVLLETPSVKALQARQPDEAAVQAMQESFRWPKERWRQVGAPSFLPPACCHAHHRGALHTGSPVCETIPATLTWSVLWPRDRLRLESGPWVHDQLQLSARHPIAGRSFENFVHMRNVKVDHNTYDNIRHENTHKLMTSLSSRPVLHTACGVGAADR